MNSKIRNIAVQLLLGFAGVCSMGPALHAQSSGATYNIPFAFHAADRVLSPGTYKVWHPSTPNVELIRPNAKGPQLTIGSGQMVLTDVRGGQTRLTFHKYGNEFYLAKVWTGQGNGMNLPVTASEKAAREQLAQSKPEDVVILASLR